MYKNETTFIEYGLLAQRSMSEVVSIEKRVFKE